MGVAAPHSGATAPSYGFPYFALTGLEVLVRLRIFLGATISVLTCVVPTYVTQSLSYLVWLESGICHRSFWHLSGHMVP